MSKANALSTVQTLAIVFGAIKVVGYLKGEKGPPPGGQVDPAEDDPRPSTLTSTQAGQIADAIEVDVYGSFGWVSIWWEWDKDWGDQLMKAQVTNDLKLILNAYGSRGTLGGMMTLSQTVAAYLDADVKATVNADYASKGILFTF